MGIQGYSPCMQLFSFFLLVAVSTGAFSATRTAFLGHKGKYIYDQSHIVEMMDKSGVDYVGLKSRTNLPYKLDLKRNEYQIYNWFLHDWYKLQDMFTFDPVAFTDKYHTKTFNEAKRAQYSKFQFDRKKFFHYKTLPTMKEWGGLTHPPVKRLERPLEFYDSNFKPINYKKINSPYFSPELQKDIDRLSRSELTFGNTVIPLVDRFAFEKKKTLIRKARHSILMSSLVFVCDDSTREVVDLLIQKHQEGVDVKILVDGFIGKALFHTKCLKMMRNAGIEVLESRDFFKHKLKAIYHTKTLVVDLNEAVAGGHNMIDADNTSRGTDFKNRDIDLYIKGPMVTDIIRQFVENWNYQVGLKATYRPLAYYQKEVSRLMSLERKNGHRGQDLYAKILANKETRMKGVCRFIKQAPYEDRHTIGKAYIALLSKVQNHLVIEDPVKTDTYVARPADAPVAEKLDSFEMFNQLHLKVQELARKGKKIDYITTNINMAGNENVAMMNERIRDQLNDGKEFWANWSLAKLKISNSYYGKPHYKNLLKDWVPHPNVHVWTHMSFIHSKVFYFDRVAASVGSYNFQHNATDQAYESTVICLDENLNRELDRILVEDMVNSIPLIYSSLR